MYLTFSRYLPSFATQFRFLYWLMGFRFSLVHHVLLTALTEGLCFITSTLVLLHVDRSNVKHLYIYWLPYKVIAVNSWKRLNLISSSLTLYWYQLYLPTMAWPPSLSQTFHLIICVINESWLYNSSWFDELKFSEYRNLVQTSITFQDMAGAEEVMEVLYITISLLLDHSSLPTLLQMFHCAISYCLKFESISMNLATIFWLSCKNPLNVLHLPTC